MSNALVGIIMGSDSDWETMAPAAAILDELGIGHKAEVVSAHRMPEDHACGFDFQKAAQIHLEKQNPKVVSSKLAYI